MQRSVLAMTMLATLVSGIAWGPTAEAQIPKATVTPYSGGGAASSVYYSPSLRAHFQLVVHQIPTFPQPFWCMRISSPPHPDSPLIPAGLGAGDFIVRLDGTHVANYAELERHVSWTTVRYIRPYGAAPETATVFINNPYYPNWGQMNGYPYGYYPVPTAPAPAAPATAR